MNKIQVIVAAANQHIFSLLNRQGDLAVAADLKVAAAVGKAQSNGAGAVNHQRASRQGMREHRDQSNRIQLRRQYRATAESE